MVDAGGSTDTSELQPADFRIIKLGDQLTVVRTMGSAMTSTFEIEQGIRRDPTRHRADLVTQQAIVDSIRFGGAGS
jgi:hypothetical protein